MKLNWIDGVPDNWNVAESQLVLDFQKRAVLEEDGIVTAFRDGRVTLRSNRRTDGFTMADKEIGYQHICEGDLVIHSMDGGFGAIGVSDSHGKASPVVHAYTSEVCDLRFISYQLRSAVNAGWIAALAKGIRVRSTQFDRPAFAGLKIAYPPLETQQRIADYLDRETAEIDAAVADLDKYVELLEKRKNSKIDLAFSSIMESKSIAPLGLFYSIANGDRGSNYPSSDEIVDVGIPFINAGDISNGSVSLSNAKFVTQEKYSNMGGAKLQVGDILFCLRGSLGKHGIVGFEEGSVASSLCVIRPLDSAIQNSHFLNYFMDSTYFAEQTLFAENGSAQPNLSGESLARFKIPVLSKPDQETLLHDLHQEMKEINNLIEESNKLRGLLLKRRAVLITDVVTGRKQV